MTLPDPLHITQMELEMGFLRARQSPRKRYGEILHEPGAYFNEVFNFILRDSYMQPHRHPSDEKVEVITVIKGRLLLHFFDDSGEPLRTFVLEPAGLSQVRVPAFTWHTYVMLTDEVLTYETMSGVYNPADWKECAPWAPKEDDSSCAYYLDMLREPSAGE